jgi:hypothetical protein
MSQYRALAITKHAVEQKAAGDRWGLARTLLLGALAAGALAVGSAAPAHAISNGPGGGCVASGSIDFSTPGSDDTCTATGPGSVAVAVGTGDTATADGTDDQAIVIGNDSQASAQFGNDNKATVIGNHSEATAGVATYVINPETGFPTLVPSSHNTASVSGNRSSATAGPGNNNHVTVFGNNKHK